MPPRKTQTADGARAASEAASGAASEGGEPPTDAATAPKTSGAAASSSSSKPTKTTESKTAKKGKGKGAAPPADTHRCFHCQSESAKMMCCSQCHLAWYCARPCQKKHWKLHKKACGAAVP